MARLINEGKGCQDNLNNLFLLFDVYNTLNPRPDGIQERANWDALDPMMPLGQPVGKRFGHTDYAGYIVEYDYRWRSGGYVVRYEDGTLRHFPKKMSLIPIATTILSYRSAPLLQSVSTTSTRARESFSTCTGTREYFVCQFQSSFQYVCRYSTQGRGF
jgi:hypothetical protein